MYSDENYFGIPEKNFTMSMRWTEEHCRQHKVETRVPTREEVRCLPFDQLRPILVGWMVHSPAELTPSPGQISVVLEILSHRSDAHAMGDLSVLCGNFIHGA